MHGSTSSGASPCTSSIIAAPADASPVRSSLARLVQPLHGAGELLAGLLDEHLVQDLGEQLGVARERVGLGGRHGHGAASVARWRRALNCGIEEEVRTGRRTPKRRIDGRIERSCDV